MNNEQFYSLKDVKGKIIVKTSYGRENVLKFSSQNKISH